MSSCRSSDSPAQPSRSKLYRRRTEVLRKRPFWRHIEIKGRKGRRRHRRTAGRRHAHSRPIPAAGNPQRRKQATTMPLGWRHNQRIATLGTLRRRRRTVTPIRRRRIQWILSKSLDKESWRAAHLGGRGMKCMYERSDIRRSQTRKSLPSLPFLTYNEITHFLYM